MHHVKIKTKHMSEEELNQIENQQESFETREELEEYEKKILSECDRGNEEYEERVDNELAFE